MLRYGLPSLFAVILVLSLQGCSRDLVGGAALGAAGAGTAYEYQNKRQMDQLERDFRDGKIDREEYFKRKEQIEKGSLIY